MSEKRFEVLFYGDVINCVKDGNGKEYNLHETIDILMKQQATIEELRLQEKEKGVPVFVVRDGKNPVALFFNEQRAMYYCQENMAHLTYQQEKWCRVE